MIPSFGGNQFLPEELNTDSPMFTAQLPVATEIVYIDEVNNQGPETCRLIELGFAEVRFVSGAVRRPHRFWVTLSLNAIHDIALVDTIL